jgi:hypothetical protein
LTRNPLFGYNTKYAKGADMAYTVFKPNQHYGPRKGLEGPFHYPNGQVLYYDPREGEYWDPRTDFFVPREDVALLQQSIFDRVSGR